MKRPCIKLSTHSEMIIPGVVSSPETSSGQAIWQIKTNNKHMKRPCI
ncbi:hypothetical protein [Labilibaculum manganireducens]|nr:hypothetical protein [Labilibaculum manganireducens]